MEYEQIRQVQQSLVDVKKFLDSAAHACNDGNAALLVDLLRQAKKTLDNIVAEI